MRTDKKGISLIILVITIIVMIILAAAIILSISNSGIMDKANKAKLDSDISTIKEIMAVYESECAFNDERVTLDGVASKLEENEVKITEKNNVQIVKNISVDEVEERIQVGYTKEITLSVEYETVKKLYVNISDNYYEIYTNSNGSMEISNEASDPNNQELEIEVKGANHVNVTIDDSSNNKIRLYGASKGTDTLTITYGGKSITYEVEVYTTHTGGAA